MANNLRVFNTNSEYQSADLVHPAVSYVVETDKVIYDLTPPTPSFKWKATYQDSHVESAQCGSSSEIVRNEINKTNLVSVEIGCVTSIGMYAFTDCRGLTSVTIPDTVTSIGDSAFEECSSLTSITIPNSVTSIGWSAFELCSNLTSITIPDSVTSIGGYAIRDCSGLTSVTIPSGVTSIGTYTFNGCSSLTSINIPSGVTSIGNYAFERCSSLTSIIINASIPPTLGGGAFNMTNNCPIYVPSASVNAYKTASGWSSYASRITCIQPPFEGKWKATYQDSHVESAQCGSSSEIVMGEINLTNLVSVEIGCVTSIGDGAFAFCSSLRDIDIPSGVTSIGTSAFTSCLYLTSIDIPNSVTTIGNVAFQNCRSLTSIVIPNSVTIIGGSAFRDCTSLTSITVNAVTPPALSSNVFNSTSNCPIYVPSQSVNAYKSANRWREYASRIYPIP